MSFRIRWVVAAFVGALALAACEDAFFHQPAPGTVPVRLSWGLAPEVAALATPQEDFDAADQADIFIESEGGEILFDGVVGLAPADNGVDKVAQVQVQVGEDENILASVSVQLLVNGSPVLQGTGSLSIVGGSQSSGIFRSYQLTSVNGTSLPATLPNDVGPGCDLRITSMRVTLTESGSWSYRIVGEEVARTSETPDCGGSADEVGGGTFVRDGGSLVLTEQDGEQISATVSGDVLTVQLEEGGVPLTLRFEAAQGAATEIFLQPVTGGSATITGIVVNALDDSPVPNAQIDLLSGFDASGGSPVSSTVSDASGEFTLTGVVAGDYTLAVTATGFIQTRLNVSVPQGATVTRTVALSEQLGAGQTRIVLTWDDSPSDLDSHITGPDGQGNQLHVSFSDQGSRDSPPYMSLDNDITTGFGPETITIWQQFPGTYCYSVHNYSGSPALSTSQATVEVFQEGSRVASFDVPGGTGEVWTVFSLDAGGITSVNRIDNQGPPGVCP